jgi:hypothetical protein
MRYQQVCRASDLLCGPDNIYITSFAFALDNQPSQGHVWTIRNMQINLSTTQRGGDSGVNLSTNFTENVGADDTIVFGPGPHEFFGAGSEQLRILLDKPFRYSGNNLLFDVRIFDGSGQFAFNNPAFDAQNALGDGVSRVYAESVDATTATHADSTGLAGVIRISPVPSLVIYISTFNTPTNYIAIEWPPDPRVFVLQESVRLGSNAIWQTVTTPTAPRYFFPVESAGSAGFFRLVWESAQQVQPGTVPALPGTSHESSRTK